MVVDRLVSYAVVVLRVVPYNVANVVVVLNVVVKVVVLSVA